MRIDTVDQFGTRKLLSPGVAADHELRAVPVAAAMNRCTNTLLHCEEQHRRRCNLYLLVIACGLERLAPREQSGGQFASALNSGAKNRRRGLVEFRVGGIEQDHAPLRKDSSVETSKGCAQKLAGAIGFAKTLHRLAIAKQGHSLVNDRKNLVPKSHYTDRRSGNAVARGSENLQSTVLAGNGDVVHLGE